MNAPQRLEIGPDRVLAYHRTAAQGDGKDAPGVVFLGGFSSDMTGTKAVWLEDWAKKRGRAFLRFDYRGHGASSCGFFDGSVGDWADDAAEAVGRLTEGPQILVGSSMGGWIALLLARRMPERLAGIVGIAAAPDFTEDLMWPSFTEAERRTVMEEGKLLLASDEPSETYGVTRRMIEEGREVLVLREPLPLGFPVRLLHGSADTDVPVTHGLKTLAHIDCADARLHIVKGADHRFSAEENLALIGETIDEITARIGAPAAG